MINKDLQTSLDGITTDHFFTKEQFARDIDYYRAQRITKSMLDAGLISVVEYDKISELNAKSFSPFLVDLLPKTLDKSCNQS